MIKLTRRIPWIGAVLVAAALAPSGCERPGRPAAEQTPPAVSGRPERLPLRWEYLFDRQADYRGDRHKIKLRLWHEAAQPASGTYKVKAFGDVVGEGGQGNNDDTLRRVNAPPGREHQTTFYYYLAGPALAGVGLGAEAVSNRVNVVLIADYVAADDEQHSLGGQWVFLFKEGEVHVLDRADQVTPHAGWLVAQGVDPSRLFLVEWR